MIKELTTEQIAKFPFYVKKWTDIGLSTDPVDLEKATDAVALAYKRAGLSPPKEIILVDSPMAAIKKIKEMVPSKSETEILNEMNFGSQESYWLSFYDFFSSETEIQFNGILDGLNEVAKNCGWISYYENVCVIQQKPELIKFDENKRLHCEDGPAIRYRDEYSVYSWHGVKIPRDWIEHKEKLTPTIALTWENVEQRRCACEILGWVKVLSSLDYRVLDSDPDPMIGDLLEVDIPEIGKEKFLQVVCGTGRTFALPVPPEMTTALEAQAWTYGMSTSDFGRGPEVRT